MQKNWHQIEIDIYSRHVVICVAEPTDKIVEWGKKAGINPDKFTKKWINSINRHQKHCYGFFASFGEKNNDYLVWLDNPPKCVSSYGTLYHELYHVVDEIAWSIDSSNGLYDKDGHSEAKAYLYEYLTRRANDFFWDKSMKGKK